MEQLFGHDFSRVRVQTEQEAMARGGGSLAITSGEEISFAVGRYAPRTRWGAALIAHELAHVLQQRRGGAEPGPEHEAEASVAAWSIAHGTNPTIRLGCVQGAIQRATPSNKDPVAEFIDESSLPTEGYRPDPREATAIGGREGERHQFIEAEAALKLEGYTEIYPKENFPDWIQKAFPKTPERDSPRWAPDVIAYHQRRNVWLVEDFTTGPWSVTEMKPGDPRRLPQEPPRSLYRAREKVIKPPEQYIAHLEKTVDNARQLARNLPREYRDAGVSARDRWYVRGGVSREIVVKPATPTLHGDPIAGAPGSQGRLAGAPMDVPLIRTQAPTASTPHELVIDTSGPRTIAPVAEVTEVASPQFATGTASRTASGTGLAAFNVGMLLLQLIPSGEGDAIQRKLGKELANPQSQAQLAMLAPRVQQSLGVVYYTIRFKVHYAARQSPDVRHYPERYDVENVEILDIQLSPSKIESFGDLNPPEKPANVHITQLGGEYAWKASRVCIASVLPVRPEIGPTYGLQGGSEIRQAVASAAGEAVERIPLQERLRIINRLFDGWVSAADVEAVRQIYQHTPSPQRSEVRQAISRRIPDLFSLNQRTRLRVMLAEQ